MLERLHSPQTVAPLSQRPPSPPPPPAATISYSSPFFGGQPPPPPSTTKASSAITVRQPQLRPDHRLRRHRAPPPRSATSTASSLPLQFPTTASSSYLPFPSSGGVRLLDPLVGGRHPEMATVPVSKHSDNNTAISDTNSSASLSYFQKTVCLQDWWLIKAEKDSQGKRLAVAGLTSREKQAVRVFSSAPIVKRYDVFTLETADGICVLMKGFINKARTEENGFPSEVFKHFVFGFPPYWEEYAGKCLGLGVTHKDVSRTPSDHGINDSNKGTSNDKKSISEERHDDNDKMDFSKDGGDGFSMKVQHSDQNGTGSASSVEDPNINSSQVLSEIFIGHVSPGVSNINSKDALQRYPSSSKTDGHLDGRSVQHGNTLDKINPSERSINRYNLRNKKNNLKDDQTAVNLLGNENNELNRVSTGNPDQLENAAVNGEVEPGVCIPCEIGYQQPTSHEIERKCGNIRSHSGKEIKSTRGALKSSVGLGNEIQDDELHAVVSKKQTNAKKASKPRSETRRRLIYESPISRGGAKKASLISPESLNLKRSRSGRLLLPTLEFWRNQMPIYDMDRRITGIQGGLHGVEPSRGSRSEPQDRKRR
ncbi:kinetochore-associated protein KNL-2 homolog isoform X2 [Diospyros lotus]|uniref:kinetochore-associated protein KNL-2 homolog isoform X2 n=1 Tax=Diospyros lotus TaxID=55363 RepID=UPI00225438F1|nr:kinetochore-associated protein KNL-2 homolog isoform X2 [Diospyros lotus]XP_052172599.1 kinetochore-associated protein KNL-2 homolog isoform X2 [Diospyros lotus]